MASEAGTEVTLTPEKLEQPRRKRFKVMLSQDEKCIEVDGDQAPHGSADDNDQGLSRYGYEFLHERRGAAASLGPQERARRDEERKLGWARSTACKCAITGRVKEQQKP